MIRQYVEFTIYLRSSEKSISFVKHMDNRNIVVKTLTDLRSSGYTKVFEEGAGADWYPPSEIVKVSYQIFEKDE